MEENTSKANNSNDQYEEYERLPILMKRYSFEEKMRIAHLHSSAAILFNQKIRKDETIVFPWCVETFVMLAIEAKEYSDGNFQGKNSKKAIKMFNEIWAATSEILRRPCGRFGFMDVFLPSTLLTQSKSQEIDWIYKYRYWYAFGHNFDSLPLKDIFEERMEGTYEEYLLFGEILMVVFLARAENKNITIPRKVLKYIFYERFPRITMQMMISRDDYIQLQHNYIKNKDDPYRYVYSLCPSVQYPLVEFKGKIYFPLPHLLIQSVTSSLMYRLTEGDVSLRREIGKHVWEQYLYDLIKDSEAYQEIVREPKYKRLNADSLAPDVVARCGKEVLFAESKSTVPSLGIRIGDEEDYEKNIDIVGEYIAKLAKRMWEFREYNPFGEAASLDRKDHWGVIVVHEDSYMRRHFYHEKAREYLNLLEESEEWTWVVEHIKVASLYEVEKICLSGYSILDAFKECFDMDPFTYPFSGFLKEGFKPTNKKALEFAAQHNKRVDKVVDEIKILLGVNEDI